MCCTCTYRYIHVHVVHVYAILIHAFLFLFYRYNNRTYRIDDIAWDINPKSTFQSYSGEDIAYVDYYKKVWLSYHKTPNYSPPVILKCPKSIKIVIYIYNVQYTHVADTCTQCTCTCTQAFI